MAVQPFSKAILRPHVREACVSIDYKIHYILGRTLVQGGPLPVNGLINGYPVSVVITPVSRGIGPHLYLVGAHPCSPLNL